ncbi:hypothetical protein BV22DRAFT_941908 [Leucogyrophana mollusca]|uniref:Uncharacterized protein n=1 Tax=Leucogyrophana mollusca TaxID=85980 RepID=A0ACB8AUE4_9AGAM|nr:hypothetical protein BV22DRAFT_941908 [Leucogyrophana mollusca]
MMSDDTSLVFGSMLRPIRQAIASHYALGYGDNEVYVFPKPGSNPMSAPERASVLLYFAAALADPLLACEVIRLGADVDQESEGVTPLQVAVSKMAWVYTEVPCRPSSDAESLNGNKTQDDPDMLYFTEKQNLLKRFQHVATSFIEQHADVNRSKDGLTPLHGACQAHSWELIALLLRHGADTSSLSTPTPDHSFLRT